MYCIHPKNMYNTYIKIWPSFSAFYLNWVTTICSQFHQFIYPKRKVKVSSSVTLWDPMDYSPPGSSVHGILQARILEWVAISFSRWSSQSRDWIPVSFIAGRFFTVWAIRKAQASLFLPLPHVWSAPLNPFNTWSKNKSN